MNTSENVSRNKKRSKQTFEACGTIGAKLGIWTFVRVLIIAQHAFN